MCDLNQLEERHDKPYDQQGTSKILFPDGRVACTGDRLMTGALLKAVLELW